MPESPERHFASPLAIRPWIPYHSPIMLQPRSLGFVHALLAVIIWSGNFVIASGFVDALPPITLAALRWSTATVFFLPFVIGRMRREWPAIRENMLPLCASALTGVTIFNTLIYISARTTDTVNLALLAGTTPVFVVLLSRLFLGEKISLFRSMGLLVAICGMVAIATRGDLDVLRELRFRPGDLTMLLAGLLWAVYSILIKRRSQSVSLPSFLGVTFLIGVIPLIPAAIIEQGFRPAWELTPGIVGAALYTGLGASLAAFFLWSSAVSLIGPGTASLFQYLTPVFSGLAAALLLGQPITPWHGIGFVLIFSGVVLATRRR
ncbi:MAG: DMT family transporter [Pseudomonadota bacterium]